MNAEAKEIPTQSMELVVVQTAITRMDKLSAGLADLQRRFGGVVFAVKTQKGMAEAKAARREIAAPRIEVEKVRKEAKAPILELGRKLDAEAKRISEAIAKIEGPIDQQIVAEENRVEAERQALIAREEARVKDITGRIDAMRTAVNLAVRARLSVDVARFLSDVQSVVVDEDLFAEFKDTAALVQRESLAELERIRDEMVARETEAERLRKDREAFERQRAEQEAKDKVEREKNEAAERERNQLANARMSEIHAMGHQVIIARTGRSGVRTGGTRECIVETLAETEQWTVTEDKFGPLLAVAQAAKASACDQIEALLKTFDQNVEQERVAADQRAEQLRIANENRELEARQQAERDAQAERDRVARENAERTEREAEAQRIANYRPTFDEIVAFVAAKFGKTPEIVRTWIREAPVSKKAAA